MFGGWILIFAALGLRKTCEDLKANNN